MSNTNAKLRDIHLNFYQGELAGIIFDNMEEKHLFVSIFETYKPIESGRIYINDEQINTQNLRKIVSKHISLIGKESTLIEAFEVSENLFFNNFDYKNIFVKKRSARLKTETLFQKFSISLSLKQQVAKLTFSEKIMLEILKAYVQNHTIILLYQFTNRIDREHLKKLIELMQLMIREGITFILLDSYEEHIIKYAKRFFLISKGRTKGSYSQDTWSHEMLHTLGMNRMQEFPTSHNLPEANGVPILEFHHVTTGAIKDLNLTIWQGEFVILKCKDDGAIDDLTQLFHNEKKLHQNIGIINENALETMLAKDITLLDNIMLNMFQRIPSFLPCTRYHPFIIKNLEEFISPADLLSKAGDLCAEVQLKALYYKWLLLNPKVVVCIKPFSVDVNHAPELIYNMIMTLIKQGIAVLFITANESDADELKGRKISIERITAET